MFYQKSCSNKYKLLKVCPSPVGEESMSQTFCWIIFWLFQLNLVTHCLSVPSWRGATAMAEWWRWQHQLRHQLRAPSGIHQWCTGAQCEALVQHQTQCEPPDQAQCDTTACWAPDNNRKANLQTHLNWANWTTTPTTLRCEFFFDIQRIFVIQANKSLDIFWDLTFLTLSHTLF